ncbi:hypothetical protein JW926_07920 [Candidatus Sumerlaeota bacterium]|nr:hypothetical protein [Candidatus Sumerlaeota bacterium]
MKRTCIIIILVFLIQLSGYAAEQFFKNTTPLPTGRQMYGAVSVGQYLYVIGGNLEPDSYTCSVIKAKINPDGTLGAWEETAPLYSPRSYINNATLSLNNCIYVVGGLNGSTDEKYRTITWTRPGENGKLEPWKESPPCPGEGVSCSVAVATPGYIHLIGGSRGQSIPITNVWSARIAADGSVVAWEEGPPLIVPLWFHCGGLADGKVWVWSGLAGSAVSSINTNIYFAPVESSGRLGAWEESNFRIPRGFYSSSCTVTGDFLLSFCPRYAHGEISGDVWFASVGSQGISEWQVVQCNLPAKHFIGVATNYLLGYVYLPGGRLNKESLEFDKTVYYFSIVAHDEANTQQAATNYTQTTPVISQSSGAVVSNESVPSYAPPQGVMSQPQASLPSQMFPGFVSYEHLKQQYITNPRPTALYFHSEANASCETQRRILGGFEPQAYRDKIILGEVDALMNPVVVNQYGVPRVPYWVFYDATGNLVNQKDGALQLHELNQILSQMAQ